MYIFLYIFDFFLSLNYNMRQVQPETLPKNSNFSSCLENILSSVILPVVKVVWGLFTSHGTFNDILMLVNVFLSLKIILPKTLQLKTGDFLQQTITMNEKSKWLKIRCYSLWVQDFSFHFYLKKKSTRGVLFCISSFFSLHRSLYLLLAYCLYWR